MKKFLTVLLALSVVFTYTVGTAFAASSTPVTGTDVAKQVNEKVASEVAAVEAAKTLYVYGVSFTKETSESDANYGVYYATVGGVKVSKAAFDKVINDVVAAAGLKIREAASKAYGETTQEELDIKLKGITPYNEEKPTFESMVTKDALTAAEKTVAKANYVAKVNGVDLTKYSDVKMTTTVKDGATETYGGTEIPVGKSRRDIVKKAQEDALEVLNDAEKLVSDMKSATETFMKVIKDVKTLDGEATEAKDLAQVKSDAAKTITNLADNSYREQYNALYLSSKGQTGTALAETQKKMTELKGKVDAVAAMYIAKVNAAEDSVAVGTVVAAAKAGEAFGEVIQNDVIAKDKIVAQVKDYAAVLKLAVVGATPLYQDGAVDAAVKDVVAGVYNDTHGKYDTYEKAKTALDEALMNKTNSDLVNQKKAAVEKATKWLETIKDQYDEKRFAEVKAIFDKGIEDINAATSYDAGLKIWNEAEAKIKLVMTIAQHTYSTTSGDLKTEFDSKYKATLEAYVDYFFATHKDANYAAPADVVKDEATKFMLEAYTKEEMASRLAGAKALVDGLKTTTDLAKEAQAVAALINAIDKDITLNSKAGITAAKDAKNAYVKLIGAKEADIINGGILTGALASLEALEVANVVKLADAIGTATLENKASVEAARTAYDAFVKEYPGSEDKVSSALSKIVAAEKAIENLNVKAVIEMIAKLPEADKVTAADEDAIKAAREAYDALSKAAQNEVRNSDKLVLAESAVKLATEIAFKTTVAKNTSTVGKGYIKLSWTAVPGADGYEVFKSTKRYSGFGTKAYFSTTKTTYKNTKGLVKGKKYYYKVRAYKVVDGKKVYGQWSTKAWRTAK